jgi:hypothetical protein
MPRCIIVYDHVVLVHHCGSSIKNDAVGDIAVSTEIYIEGYAASVPSTEFSSRATISLIDLDTD